MNICLKAEELEPMLLPGLSWVPFTESFWQALPEDIKSACVHNAQDSAGFKWPPVLAADFMAFRRDGNRVRMEDPYFARRMVLISLVLGECVEGKGRFIDDIINGIWAICEEASWTVSAHSQSARYPDSPLPDPKEPIVDLFAAETAAILAWSVFLVRKQLDAVTPIISEHAVSEIDRRVITPYQERWDFWYMGRTGAQINNWTPWIASNVLGAALLTVDDTDRRAAIVEKSLEMLQTFLDTYETDGGCDEGSSYWGYAAGALFNAFEYLYLASGGKLDFFRDEKVRNMGRYIARVHISDDWFVNFADGSAKLGLSVGVVYRYGLRSGDSSMMSLAAETARNRGAYQSSCRELFRELHTMADWQDMLSFKSIEAEQEVFIRGIDVMIAREKVDGGFFVAVKAGHNAESHNHNDVGQFIVFHDGQPVLIDAGVETYTRQTFISDRYSIWTMRSDWHNLPTIGGNTQSPGREHAARDVHYDSVPSLTMDIAGAYPEEAGVRSWKRKVALDRTNGEVLVKDTWVLKSPQAVELHLVVAAEPQLQDGLLIPPVGDRGVAVTIPDGCSVKVDERTIDDRRLSPVWGERVWRVNLIFPPAMTGNWTLHVRRLPATLAV